MSMQEVREQNIALVTQTALACFVENGIEKTTIRDIAQHAALESAGWHVIVVWECELAKPVREARLERLYTEITAPGSMASNELAGLANAAGSVNAGGSIV